MWHAATVAVAAALACAAPVRAQAGGSPFSFLDNLFNGNAANAPSAQPTPGAPGQWSGEDGASGHPLMTASAIREAAANFDNCIAGMWPDAARRNISQDNFQRFTAGLTPDLHIMDLLDAQPAYIPNGTIGQWYPVYTSGYSVQSPMGRYVTIGLRAAL